jgi:hypothetical protein
VEDLCFADFDLGIGAQSVKEPYILSVVFKNAMLAGKGITSTSAISPFPASQFPLLTVTVKFCYQLV